MYTSHHIVKDRRNAGYTLVEVAVALVLSSVVSVAAYQAYITLNNIVLTWEENVHDSTSLIQVLDRCVSDFYRASYVQAGDNTWHLIDVADDTTTYRHTPQGMTRNGHLLFERDSRMQLGIAVKRGAQHWTSATISTRQLGSQDTTAIVTQVTRRHSLPWRSGI